jgi:hypothetical protein
MNLPKTLYVNVRDKKWWPFYTHDELDKLVATILQYQMTTDLNVYQSWIEQSKLLGCAGIYCKDCGFATFKGKFGTYICILTLFELYDKVQTGDIKLWFNMDIMSGKDDEPGTMTPANGQQ